MTPVPVLAPGELRAVEERAAQRGLPLMQRAGEATAHAAAAMAADTGAAVLVVAGPGNNGGDAWVAAAHLARSFHRVVVLDVDGGEPRAEAARVAKAACGGSGVAIVREWPAGRFGLVVDGLLGLGLSRDVDARYRALVDRINGAGAPVLAIDVPSGLDSGTGCVRGAAVRATRTLTFIAHKPGLHTAEGPDHAGEVVLDALGLDAADLGGAHGALLAPAMVRGWLRPRRRNAHKGQFGTLGVVGGHAGMVGAALLAGRAALHAGAGKVVVGLLGADAPAVDLAFPELMLRPVDDAMRADVLVAGPGAGPAGTAFEGTLLPAMLAGAKPLVLDADALNAIARRLELRADLAAREAPTLLTPHPAEAARLLDTSAVLVQSDRVGTACRIARELKAHVVLKGAGSVCAFPDGRWSINTTGNAGLASGGTGDVLAGLAGALLCQGLAPERALQLAVCVHGAAADALVARGAGPVGLTASEVSLEARRLLNAWSGEKLESAG